MITEWYNDAILRPPPHTILIVMPPRHSHFQYSKRLFGNLDKSSLRSSSGFDTEAWYMCHIVLKPASALPKLDSEVLILIIYFYNSDVFVWNLCAKVMCSSRSQRSFRVRVEWVSDFCRNDSIFQIKRQKVSLTVIKIMRRLRYQHNGLSIGTKSLFNG